MKLCRVGTYAGVPKDSVNLTLSEEHFMKAYHAGHYKSPLMVNLCRPCFSYATFSQDMFHR